jgi:hypothetical protein
VGPVINHPQILRDFFIYLVIVMPVLVGIKFSSLSATRVFFS